MKRKQHMNHRARALNNGNPSSSRGPCEFQRLLMAGWLKSLLKALP